MSIDNKLLDALEAKLKDGYLPEKSSEKAALDRLKPYIRALMAKKYSAAEIAEFLGNELGVKLSGAQVAAVVKPRKPKNGAAKKEAGADAKAPEEKQVKNASHDTPAADTSAGEKGDGKAAAKPKQDKPDPVRLEDVQEWREAEGIVILKTTTALKPKTRIYTESGKVAEVTICKPTTYGSGFSKHDGMEVSFVLEKE